MSTQAAVSSLPLTWRPMNIAFSSNFSTHSRLAVSSFESSSSNVISVTRVVGPSLLADGTATVSFPQTHIQFSPMNSPGESDLLITTAEALRIWQVGNGVLTQTGLVPASLPSEIFSAADWSSIEENLAVLGSTEGTVTIVDLSSLTKVSTIIAHDHSVHDLAFCGTTPTFITAGFDGSLRFFDLRDLMSSYIFYQTAKPLLRVSVSPLDSNKIATFATESGSVVIVDGRQPGMPCALIKHASQRVTSVAWSHLITDRVFSTNVDGGVLASNVTTGKLQTDSEEIYKASTAIQASSTGLGMVGIVTRSGVEILKDVNREFTSGTRIPLTDGFVNI